MSNTHIHVPSLSDLKKELELKGLEEFIKAYSRYESIIGNTESVQFLEEQNEILKNIKKENIC